MATIHTLVGKKVKCLKVIRRTKNERGNRARFICKCNKCGKEQIRFASDLITGKCAPCDCTSSKKSKSAKSKANKN